MSGEQEPVLELILSVKKSFLNESDDKRMLDQMRMRISTIGRINGYLTSARTAMRSAKWCARVQMNRAAILFQYGVEQQIIAYPEIVNPYDRIMMNHVGDEITKMALYYAQPTVPEGEKYTTHVKIPEWMTDSRLLLFVTFLDEHMRNWDWSHLDE